MNGERVKFMGRVGKSKEPVVAGTRGLEIRVGDEPGRWVGPGSNGSWMSN